MTSPTAVSICPDGNVVVGGAFFGQELNIIDSTGSVKATLVPQYSHMNGVRDFSAAFYAKFDQNGVIQWAKEWSGPTDVIINSMSCVSSTRIILSGRFPPGSNYLPPTSEAQIQTGGTILPQWWLTQGVPEAAGNIYLEGDVGFNQTDFPIFASGDRGTYSTGTHYVVVNSRVLLFTLYEKGQQIVALQHPLSGVGPVLSGRTTKLGWSYEWVDGDKVIIRVSSNNTVFLESAPIKAEPIMANVTSPGPAGWARRLADGTWWAASNWNQFGSLRLWRGQRIALAIDGNGDHVWSSAMNITADSSKIAQTSSGLLFLAGKLPNTGTLVVNQSMESGGQLWQARLQSIPGNSSNIEMKAITTDSQGNSAVLGFMGRTTSVSVVDSTGAQVWRIDPKDNSNAFIVGFTTTGKYQWSVSFSTPGILEANALAVDYLGNFAVGIRSSMQLDLYNNRTDLLRSLNGPGTFILKYSSIGALLDVTSLVTSGASSIASIAFTNDSVMCVGGDFNGDKIDVMTQYTTYSNAITSSTGNGGFILKLNYKLSNFTRTWVSTSTLNPSPTNTRSTTSIGDDQLRFYLSLSLMYESQSLSESLRLNVQRDTEFVGQQQQNTIIIVLAIMGACVLLIGIALLRYRKLKKSKLATAVSATNRRTSVLADVTTTSSTTTDFGSGRTDIVTTHELSIPAFLQLNYGMDFRQEEIIASGGGGTIYHCAWLDFDLAERCQNSPLVLKRVADSENALSDRMKVAVYQEISLMWRFRDHPNFVKFYGFSRDPFCMVMKFYQWGTLDGFIHAKPGKIKDSFRYNKTYMVSLLRQYCTGIAFMHSKGIAHCDIKPANVLIDAKDRSLIAIITDFGISRVVDKSRTAQVQGFLHSVLKGASISYASPGVLMRFRSRIDKPDTSVWFADDVFALSITICEALMRKSPWV